MIKKFVVVSVLICMALAVTLTGCGSSAAKTPTVAEIVQKIKQASDISQMHVADAAKLKQLYGINSSDLKDFALYTASSYIKADEIGVFEAKDASGVDTIKADVTKRIDAQAQSFKGYLPNQYYLIQHNILEVKGDYVILIISKDAQKISSAVDQAFN